MVSADMATRERPRSPLHIPLRGWKEVLLRVKRELRDDHVSILSAGVAFYFMLAVFPGLLTLVTLYGLVSDPADVQRQIAAMLRVLPPAVVQLIGARLRSLVNGPPAGLRFGFVVSLGAALWTASSGARALLEAVNLAYDEVETRGWLKLRGQALLFTIAMWVFGVTALVTITGLPWLLGWIGLAEQTRVFVSWARWPFLFTAVIVAFGTLYRYGPNREPQPVRWVAAGSLLAATLWIAASIGLSVYASSFGRFDQTYGTLAGAIVLLLWLWLSAFAILLGGELNSELERQGRKALPEGDPNSDGW